MNLNTITLWSVTLLISIWVVSCSSPKSTNTEAESTSAAEQPAAPEKPSVFFVSPSDGDTLASPVYVRMGVKGMTVEPSGEVREGYGHHHILVNQDYWPQGEVIPATDTTIHYGKGQTETEVELPPGNYKLSLQFADGVHTSYGPDMAASINVVVQ